MCGLWNLMKQLLSQKSKNLAIVFKNKAYFNQNHMNMTTIYIKAC